MDLLKNVAACNAEIKEIIDTVLKKHGIKIINEDNL